MPSASSPTPTVVVVGAATPAARRILATLPGARLHRVAERADLKAALAGVDAVVDLGGDPARTRAVLDAAGDASVAQVVLLSSATVYGARADNPVPIPEDAPVRPTGGFGPAVAHAECERLTSEWVDEHPAARAAVLRCAVVVGPAGPGEIEAQLLGATGVQVRGGVRPVQVLHEDDLAAAVRIAVERGLSGPYNVAPDKWIAPDTAEALAVSTSRLALPERLARPLAAAGRIVGVGRRPEGIDTYLEHPWVVANDRFRQLGWTPTHANDEALVSSQPSSWWRDLSPRRRQELALGVTGVLGLVSVAAVVVGVFRRRRRARR